MALLEAAGTVRAEVSGAGPMAVVDLSLGEASLPVGRKAAPGALVVDATGSPSPEEIRQGLEDLAPSIPVVALCPVDGRLAAELLRGSLADACLRIDAIGTLPAVLEGLLAGEARPLPGVWRMGDDGRVEPAPAGPQAAAPPTPAWDLVELEAYGRSAPGSAAAATTAARVVAPLRRIASTLRQGPGGPRAMVETQRSCAPDCPTCHGSFGRRAGERPVAEIVREVRHLVGSRGVRHLTIVDHAFDGQPRRAAEIARAIARIRSAPHLGGLRVDFAHGFRGDGLTDELVEALVGMGLRRFDLAVGTASDRLQRLLKTNVHLGRAADGIERIEAAGATARLRLYLGLPTETTGEAAHTIRWAARSAASEVRFLRGADVDLGPHFAGGLLPGELDDFEALRRRGLRAFYGARPRRILRRCLPGHGLPAAAVDALAGLGSRARRDGQGMGRAGAAHP